MKDFKAIYEKSLAKNKTLVVGELYTSGRYGLLQITKLSNFDEQGFPSVRGVKIAEAIDITTGRTTSIYSNNPIYEVTDNHILEYITRNSFPKFQIDNIDISFDEDHIFISQNDQDIFIDNKNTLLNIINAIKTQVDI